MRFLYAVLPLFIGFVLDCILGDPYSLPHPIRAIGSLISVLEKRLRKGGNLRRRGALLTIIVLGISVIVPTTVLVLCYILNVWLGICAEGIMCYYLLAARCLMKESMKVYYAEKSGDTESARRAVSMIVGRDTAVLDDSGIIRAAVETVAENTSDGVTAPILFIMLGGAPLGFFYKACNTMDSMIGYKNEKYIEFGRTAAKFDDILNYIPSRLTALAMILASYILGFDGKNSFRIWKRDRRKHASPNSAQTESAAAGALRVRLAGDAWYFGKLHKKEYIGDDIRGIENEDIPRTNRLMYGSTIIILIIALLFRAAVWGWIF